MSRLLLLSNKKLVLVNDKCKERKYFREYDQANQTH